MDITSILGSLSALLLVLGLIFLSSILLRKYTMKMGTKTSQKGKNRLEIVETTIIDAKRKLVLIRRDDVEHLICMGGDKDVVVESGIKRHSREHTSVEGGNP